jgi:hypothetical protein
LATHPTPANPGPAATKTPIERLIFVYRADSGRLSSLIDSARKLLMIDGCALCTITHGLAGERGEWKSCRDEIGVPVDYVHRDELDGDLAAAVGDDLPCVVAEAAGRMTVLLTPQVIERCRGSVDDLRGRLRIHAAMKDLVLPETRVA